MFKSGHDVIFNVVCDGYLASMTEMCFDRPKAFRQPIQESTTLLSTPTTCIHTVVDQREYTYNDYSLFT